MNIPNIDGANKAPQILADNTKNSNLTANLTEEGAQRVQEALSQTVGLDNPAFNDDGTIKDLQELERLMLDEDMKESIKLENSNLSWSKYMASVDSDGDGKYDQYAYFDESGNKIEEIIDRNENDTERTTLKYDENGQIDEVYDGEDFMCYKYNETVEEADGKKVNTLIKNKEGFETERTQYTDGEITYVAIDYEADGKTDYERGEYYNSREKLSDEPELEAPSSGYRLEKPTSTNS